VTGAVSPRGLGSYDDIEIELPVGWMLATCNDRQKLADDLHFPDWVLTLPPDDEGTWPLTMGQAIRHGLLADWQAAQQAERDQAKKLVEAMQGLLDALPSATTHPAIKAARAAIASYHEENPGPG